MPGMSRYGLVGVGETGLLPPGWNERKVSSRSRCLQETNVTTITTQVPSTLRKHWIESPLINYRPTDSINLNLEWFVWVNLQNWVTLSWKTFSECRICRKLIVIYVVCSGRRIWLSLSLWQSLLQVHYIFPLNIISENNKSDWRLSVRLVTILNMWSYRFWRSKYKIFFPGKKYWPDIAVSMRTSPPNKTETAIIPIESPRTKQNGWNTASCWKKYANVSVNSGDCLLSEMIINRYAKMCKFARGGGGLNWNGMTGYELNN